MATVWSAVIINFQEGTKMYPDCTAQCRFSIGAKLFVFKSVSFFLAIHALIFKLMVSQLLILLVLGVSLKISLCFHFGHTHLFIILENRKLSNIWRWEARFIYFPGTSRVKIGKQISNCYYHHVILALKPVLEVILLT